MRRLRVRRMLLALAACASIAAAGELDDGIAAFDAGNDAVAAAKLVPRAEAGDARAKFYAAQLYWLGRGVAQDYDKAFDYMRSAADAGDARAQLGIVGYLWAVSAYPVGHVRDRYTPESFEREVVARLQIALPLAPCDEEVRRIALEVMRAHPASRAELGPALGDRTSLERCFARNSTAR